MQLMNYQRCHLMRLLLHAFDIANISMSARWTSGETVAIMVDEFSMSNLVENDSSVVCDATVMESQTS